MGGVHVRDHVLGRSNLSQDMLSIRNYEKSHGSSWGITFPGATQVKMDLMVLYILAIRQSLSTSFLLSWRSWRWSNSTSRAVLGGTGVKSLQALPIFFCIVSRHIFTRSPKRGSLHHFRPTATLLKCSLK